LRQKFINAAVGISGANIAIAETGTIVLVTNEGNAALATTLPPVHIAVFGIDKLVASLDDAVAILRVLPRSGTGQRITSYIDWITGPSRSADIEQSLTIGVHGPREMHCVVLDNGREEMRASPIFREALHCIRCGACSNACPPFMAVTGHQFGHIYSGPIGLVLTPFHHGDLADDWPNSLCVQCNACQEICPVDIPLPRQILEHRRHARKPVYKEPMLELWSRPALVQTAMQLSAPLGEHVPKSPGPLAPRPYRRLFGRDGAVGAGGEPAVIFASCMVDRMLPGPGVALEQILRAAGHSPVFPEKQWCCGLVCANAGDFGLAAKLNRQLTDALAGTEGPIITPSTSCFGAYTLDAPDWGVDDARQKDVAARMQVSTRFVLELLETRPELVDATAATGERPRVAYHDSCQSLRQLHLRDEPRRLLELAGYEVVDLPDIANCCGFGGTFSIDWPQVAARLLDWKLDALAKTGCTVLASDNPGCLMHIGNGGRKRGVNVRVAHVLELVAERLTTAVA
jgi:Fe-S oxidoreductase